MVTLPAEGRWSIRSLSDDDAGPALAFLRRDPLINVYLISRLLEERFVSATQTIEVRYSTTRDLDLLVPACAAMHNEEVGIDPLERDAPGYRERIRELVEKKRSLIRVIDKTIVAKCEFSAVTPEAVQLMGVWTDPRYRRRGLGRALLREVCGHLARRGRSVTLFVNDFNRPAIALYESLGFKRIGVNRALIW